MIEIDIEQGTPKWHEFRQEHIGASDSAPILGTSPYKTRLELWNEKMGLSPSPFQTDSMRFGSEKEGRIREAMSSYLDCHLKPKVFIHDIYSWMSASVDGIDIDKGIVVEIKCANKYDHEQAKNNFVPNKYYSQLQHILEVCGLGKIWYCSFHKDDLVYFPVENDYFFIENMITQEKQFWDSMQNFKQPEISELPKEYTKEYINNILKNKEYTKEPIKYNNRTDEQWRMLAGQWISIQSQKKELLMQEENLKNALITFSGKENAMGFGIKITNRQRKGSIDYSTITELKNVDLEKYRKPATQLWMIEND